MCVLHVYKCAYNICVLATIIWGSVFNFRHPSPRHEWSGVGSCGSCATLGGLGESAPEFREVSFYAQASQTLSILTETDVHFRPQVIPSSPWEPKVSKWSHGVPREPKGSQSDAKESPLGARDVPKGPKRGPKDGPRKAKWVPKPFKGDQPITNIHIQRIHANSRSTAIQRPTSTNV